MMDHLTISTFISIFLGIGLAAAAGFRIFLPLFILSLAVNLGGNYIHIDQDWKWIGSLPAIITLGAAMVIEIVAYFIPVIDNVLDTLSVPLAAVAGTLAVAINFPEMNEVATWAFAIIAGGGTATAISGTTAAVRAVSTTTTAGSGNFIVNSVETVSSTVLSLLAIVIAPLAFIVVLGLLYATYRVWKKISTGPSLISKS